MTEDEEIQRNRGFVRYIWKNKPEHCDWAFDDMATEWPYLKRKYPKEWVKFKTLFRLGAAPEIEEPPPWPKEAYEWWDRLEKAEHAGEDTHELQKEKADKHIAAYRKKHGVKK